MADTAQQSNSTVTDSRQKSKLTSLQLAGLEEFGKRINTFGFNFAICDGSGCIVLQCDGGEFDSRLRELSKASEMALASDAGEVKYFDRDNHIFAMLLPIGNAVAVIDCGIMTGRFAQINAMYLKEMLRDLAQNLRINVKANEQVEMISSELAQTYEELVLLYKISTKMKVNTSVPTYLQMACDNLTDIVNVEGIAIFLKKVVDDEEQLILSAGAGLIDIDTYTTVNLYSRLLDEIKAGAEALFDSEVDSPFKNIWPHTIRNIMAVPMYGGSNKNKSHLNHILPGLDGAKANYGSQEVIGFLVAVNRLEKPDFDSIDSKLFNCVASECAVFINNGTLFSDLKELFIGSLKAMTSSIDAKDQYTRGHSERVAMIARWIATRLAETNRVEQEMVHYVYLAGLLHDIGKIGISEDVLRKTCELTTDERTMIQAHPVIGANILEGIKQIHQVVPGVLHHHERYDGKGYPKGVAGENIPLIGRIICLADCFDAMTSKRTYRDAMTVEQAVAQIEKGMGTQFDEMVGRCFIESNIEYLWAMLQKNFGNDMEYDSADNHPVDGYLLPGYREVEEYGSVAVEALLR